jgi:transcriptional regulator
MASLTERQRDVFVARADGHTFEGIGRLLGSSQESAIQHHRAAEAKIARHLLPLLYEAVREGDK